MMRLWIAVALLCIPVWASADPITSTILVAAAGSTFWTTVAVIGITMAETIIVNFALGKVSQLLGGKRAGSSTPSSQTITVRSAVAPLEIIYGEVKTSGVIVHQATSGSKNERLWTVIALAGHQVEEITDVWLGSERILDANINPTTGAVTQSPFTGKLNIWRLTGTDAQAVQSDWDSAFADVTTNHRGRGVALLVVRMERDGDAFPTGAPDNIYALTKGKRVYDPRKDSTNGGSGSHRLDDVTTWEWSDNPALCEADYITGGSMVFDVATPINRLGMRSTRIDWDLLISSANKCDEDVDIPGGTEKRYRCALKLSCADTHETNLELIEATMHGNHVYSAGYYRIYPGQYDVPTETITDDDLKDAGYKVIGADSQTQIYNQVCGTYFDPARDYLEQTSYIRTDSAFETEDGKPILRTIDLQGVPSEYQAQRICEIVKQESRNQEQVELNLKLSGLRIQPWRTYTLQLRELAAGDSSWNAKVFRPQVIEIDLQQRLVKVTGRVETATAYADLLDSEYNAAGSASAARYIESPDEATGLTATSIPLGILFEVTLPSFMGPDTVVELFRHSSSAPYSAATKVAEFDGPVFVYMNTGTGTNYYWVRLFNKRTQQFSAEYPTSAAGVSAAGRLTATGDIDSGAATVIYTDTLASIGPSGGSTNPLEIAITEAGVYEVSVSALFTVSTFSGTGTLIVSLTAPSSSGSFTEVIWTTYPVTALNQRIEAILKNTYVTTGSGPWTMRFGFADSGAGNTFTGTQLSMRVTVVRR